MFEPPFRRASTVLAAALLTATLGAVLPCAGGGAACGSAATAPAAPDGAAVMAAAGGPACPGTASAQAAALQSSDGDAAPASPPSRLRFDEGGVARRRPLLPEPRAHSFHDGTALYLVVSSLLI